MDSYLMMTLFLEIMKCRLLSEPISEQMLFRASTCVTVGAKGILNMQNPPVLWNKSGVERQREWLNFVCVFVKSENVTLLLKSQNLLTLTSYSPGYLGSCGCCTDTSRQGILKMTSFGKTFLKSLSHSVSEILSC